MRRRTKRIITVIVIILILVFLAGMLGPLMPPTHMTTWKFYYCTNCGMRRSRSETGRVGRPLTLDSDKLVENSLSQWYREHYKEGCQHNWRRYHSSVGRYVQIWRFRWAYLWEMGGRPMPGFCNVNDDDRAILEKLFAEDPGRCQNYIRLRLLGQERESIISLSTAEMEALLRKLAEEEKLQESAQ